MDVLRWILGYAMKGRGSSEVFDGDGDESGSIHDRQGNPVQKYQVEDIMTEMLKPSTEDMVYENHSNEEKLLGHTSPPTTVGADPEAQNHESPSYRMLLIICCQTSLRCAVAGTSLESFSD